MIGATSACNARSEFTDLALDSIYPATSQPGNTVLYSIKATRTGQGLLLVDLSIEGLPAGATATFSPSVLRFTGRNPETLTSVITITCSELTKTDMYPLKVRGIARRDDQSLVFTTLLTQGVQIPTPSAPVLRLDRSPGGVILVHGAGSSGVTYQIEATADLVNPSWSGIGSSTADGNGKFTYVDTQTSELPVRFYRAVQPGSTAIPPAH